MSELELNVATRAFPIAFLGNEAAVAFGRKFLEYLYIPIDQNFVPRAVEEGSRFNHVVALIFVGLSEDEFAAAAE
jgi:hypothetical protein